MSLDLNLHSKQYEFMRKAMNNRYTVFIGGVGSGKTHAGAKYALAMTQRSPGMTGLIAAQTSPMLRDVIIPEFEKVLPSNLLVDYNKMEQKMRIKTYNGDESTILFRSLYDRRKIDRIRGLTINWAWFDEITYIDEYAFEVCQGRLREGDNQRFIGTGTPKGFDWVYDRFVDGNDDNEEYASVLRVSTDNNPYLPDNYVDDLKNEYSDEYLRQEFFGEFVKFQGLIYKEFKSSDHVLSEDEVEGKDFKAFIAGYDAGYRHPRVLLLIGLTNRDEYVVVDEFYQKEINLSDAITYFEDMVDRDNFRTVYADPSARAEIEEMKKQGIRVEGGDNEVETGIQKVKEFLSNDNLFISDKCKKTIEEFNSYRWKDDKDAPVKEKDHAMDALRYAIYTHESSGDAGVVMLNDW